MFCFPVVVVGDHSLATHWLRWVPRELYGPLLEASFAGCKPLAVGELVQKWPERRLRVGGRRKRGQRPPCRLCVQALLLAVVRGLSDQRFALRVLDLCGLQAEEPQTVDSMGGWSLTIAVCTMVVQAQARERKRLRGLVRDKEVKGERGQCKRVKDANGAKSNCGEDSAEFFGGVNLIKGVRRRMEIKKRQQNWRLEGDGKECHSSLQVRADIFVNARSWERVYAALSAAGPLELQCRYLHVEEVSMTSIGILLDFLPPRGLLGVDVRYSNLGVAGLAHLLPRLAAFPDLSSLSLHYCNLDLRRDRPGQEEALRDLSQGLAQLRGLQRLSLTALRLPGQLRVLLSSLPRPLEVLELPYLSLRAADLAYLSCSHHASSLQQLDLSENRLYADTLPAVRHLLSQASGSLRRLSLRGCGLSDDLLGPLLPSLGCCSSLRSLALALNPLSAAGLVKAVRTAARMPSMRWMLYPNPLEDYQPGLPEMPSSAQLMEWPLYEAANLSATRNLLHKVLQDCGREDIMLTCDLLSYDHDLAE
ncbi:leucine-rich repeat-containing protein 14 isoform X2 [Syngnathoides biaculeatus]|uniref:leucine-rich repeat-containing protein 14 isoform X2 n=1 Tax=Syngnathoides biaculeatus TaxID=300417 RepID=UPI002ADDEE7B|nr:leucine-rich repeat-containing protein 14 isoform X2 [Syngnathoides biaculeatus]